MRPLSFTLVGLMVCIGSGHAQATARPWPARRPPAPPAPAHQLLDVGRWPIEPPSPVTVDPVKFRVSVAYLCRKDEDNTPANEVLAAAREAGVDPFLLAALMSERSKCDPKRKTRHGVGLLALSPALYQSAQAPKAPGAAIEWTNSSLVDPRANLGLGARLLRMWEEQHAGIDAAFRGVAHRSAVSHFYWGDVVGSSGSEDLVLTTRRRLLANYQGLRDEPKINSLGLAVVPPLEASPRVASSGPGDDRDGGARRHRGLDLAAVLGEPVRAVADGTVIFAGVNQRSNARLGPIAPEKSARYANRRLGPGGIYLCIRHSSAKTEDHSVVSCYMHLERYMVAAGDTVTAGQTIGIVGHSGVNRSPPHLHFEMRVDDQCKDPIRYFANAFIPPKETLTHRYNVKSQRARLRAARIAAASAKS